MLIPKLSVTRSKENPGLRPGQYTVSIKIKSNLWSQAEVCSFMIIEALLGTILDCGQYARDSSYAFTLRKQ